MAYSKSDYEIMCALINACANRVLSIEELSDKMKPIGHCKLVIGAQSRIIRLALTEILSCAYLATIKDE